ncbi:MAG: lipocalin-like domain-containing protein [Bacteroidota bacterium]|nr:lipocalin-like domain-containing protein [Bacteroidota bacterium]
MTTEQKQLNLEVPAITLPADQYAHPGAPTEWWWHVGTLVADNGRKFGFEINAAMMFGGAFIQIEITDVQNQCNYQNVSFLGECPSNWAESDPTKPWYVKLSGVQATVNMQAIGGNPLNMNVTASFIDATTGSQCSFYLNLNQQGAPLLVWGTGVEQVNPSAPTPLQQNNYYYSLTNLAASGHITIGGSAYTITGTTWMDHEYGAFPQGTPGQPVIWMLQDMQLSHGLHLSNFTKFGVKPQLNVPIESYATMLYNGESTFVETTTIPMGPTYVSKKGVTYYMTYKILLKNSSISFVVNSSYPNQVFVDPSAADVYEGVATAEMLMTLHLSPVKQKEIVIASGPAWIEQNLG